MIRARRLFLIPAISLILLFVPAAGIPLYLLVLGIWYIRNQEDIHAYFVGKSYRKDEYSEEEQEKWA